MKLVEILLIGFMCYNGIVVSARTPSLLLDHYIPMMQDYRTYYFIAAETIDPIVLYDMTSSQYATFVTRVGFKDEEASSSLFPYCFGTSSSHHSYTCLRNPEMTASIGWNYSNTVVSRILSAVNQCNEIPRNMKYVGEEIVLQVFSCTKLPGSLTNRTIHLRYSKDGSFKFHSVIYPTSSSLNNYNSVNQLCVDYRTGVPLVDANAVKVYPINFTNKEIDELIFPDCYYVTLLNPTLSTTRSYMDTFVNFVDETTQTFHKVLNGTYTDTFFSTLNPPRDPTFYRISISLRSLVDYSYSYLKTDIFPLDIKDLSFDNFTLLSNVSGGTVEVVVTYDYSSGNYAYMKANFTITESATGEVANLGSIQFPTYKAGDRYEIYFDLYGNYLYFYPDASFNGSTVVIVEISQFDKSVWSDSYDAYYEDETYSTRNHVYCYPEDNLGHNGEYESTVNVMYALSILGVILFVLFVLFIVAIVVGCCCCDHLKISATTNTIIKT
eukprot:TRINITY_DN7141_c0_g1_i1.p1 TRINITY_DN7141_c0_g1~~TRINITY_DN7141_c0_g1_i1.p1  ORF type:complete len:495 (-),score=19.51 TRINITY_DN7141_c0_g1_i1:104-1588(-)